MDKTTTNHFTIVRTPDLQEVPDETFHWVTAKCGDLKSCMKSLPYRLGYLFEVSEIRGWLRDDGRADVAVVLRWVGDPKHYVKPKE